MFTCSLPPSPPPPESHEECGEQPDSPLVFSPQLSRSPSPKADTTMTTVYSLVTAEVQTEIVGPSEDSAGENAASLITAEQLVAEVELQELKGGLSTLQSLLRSADMAASDSSAASDQSLEWEPEIQLQPCLAGGGANSSSQVAQPSLQEELLTADSLADASPKSSEDSKGKCVYIFFAPN